MPPGGYITYRFELPERICSIRGRVEGISGGNKDFEGLILAEDEFTNWKANLAATGVVSGRKVVWNPIESIQGPGVYYFIVSNAFSTVTAKAVVVSAAAECPA